MLTKTKIAVAVVLVLGAASAAFANDIDVNPSSAQSAREWAEYSGQHQKQVANPRTSFGYALPSQQELRKKGHNH
jgi:hypothetical protein